MRSDPKIITLALDAYFKGMSLRDVTDHIKQFYGVKVHYSTILRWIGKYTRLIAKYVDGLTPAVTDTWHVDEMTLALKIPKEGGKKGQGYFFSTSEGW